jgi:hypothetical protein
VVGSWDLILALESWSLDWLGDEVVVVTSEFAFSSVGFFFQERKRLKDLGDMTRVQERQRRTVGMCRLQQRENVCRLSSSAYMGANWRPPRYSVQVGWASADLRGSAKVRDNLGPRRPVNGRHHVRYVLLKGAVI